MADIEAKVKEIIVNKLVLMTDRSPPRHRSRTIWCRLAGHR